MNTRAILLTAAVVLIIGGIIYFESIKRPSLTPEEREKANIHIDIMNKEEKAKQYEVAKEITSPNGYINTEGIKVKDLIGKKVVMIDFWTYSCINCQRTTPFLNAWYEKYKDQGLEIIGVHTPEFDFEKKYENVQDAVDRFGIKFPVVLDNDFSTWQAYENRYWPHKYIIDIDGFIVYDHIGEGGYEETEMKIQELLNERTRVLGMEDEISTGTVSPEAEKVNTNQPQSPEIYFGAWRNERLGNGIRGIEGNYTFEAPGEFVQSVLYLDGKWRIAREFAENGSPDDRIIFKYLADKVFMVAASENEEGVEAEIFRDGELVKTITIKEEALYRLIEPSDLNEEKDNVREHLLEIRIKSPGLQAFTFTFG
jgi:thiol-disulfide isomerase/thioredoxin